MILKILLLISIVFQLSAAVIAIKLTRVTKYNLSWILITIALTAMALQRLVEFMQVGFGKEFTVAPDFYVWIGVATSIFFASGVFLIRKILTYISKVEGKRRLDEKRILNAIIETEERERQRFSTEIHDGLGPLLSSVKMSVSALAKMATDPTQIIVLENTNIVVDEAVKSLKEISNNMNPHMLNNFGLARALANFINKLSSLSSVKINLDTNIKNNRFDSNIEIILYRVICEMINNSLKHANATKIDVSLRLKGDEIFIIVEDDGKGFNPEDVLYATGGGMGLSNIISRIESIKGSIEIDSKPGYGTKISVCIK